MNKQDIKNAELKAKMAEEERSNKVIEMYYHLAKSYLLGRVSSPVVRFAEAVVISYEQKNPVKEKK